MNKRHLQDSSIIIEHIAIMKWNTCTLEMLKAWHRNPRAHTQSGFVAKCLQTNTITIILFYQ